LLALLASADHLEDVREMVRAGAAGRRGAGRRRDPGRRALAGGAQATVAEHLDDAVLAGGAAAGRPRAGRRARATAVLQLDDLVLAGGAQATVAEHLDDSVLAGGVLQLDDLVLAGGAQATVVLLDDAVLAGGVLGEVAFRARLTARVRRGAGRAGRDPGRRGWHFLAVSAGCYPLTSASSSRLVLPERIGSSMFRDGGCDGGRPERARKKPK
jgi:hypothetical protein